MRRALVVIVLATLVIGRPVPARAHHDVEFGLAMEAAALNIVYTPAKFLTAIGGLALGGLTGLLTGGDTRAAYAVWAPTASGTFMLTPAHLEGKRPIEFFGSDYADRPSDASGPVEGRGIYEAQYSR